MNVRSAGISVRILSALLLSVGISGTNLQGATMEKGGVSMKLLPPPIRNSAVSVEKAISLRRSVRNFTSSKLTDQQISQLLYAAQGITDTLHGFRAAPSAGATYPLICYVVTGEGVFRYLPEKHALESVKKGNLIPKLGEAAWGQTCVSSAPAVVVFTAIYERTTTRYGERGQRYVHMEVGHAAQNVHLQAEAMGLGSVAVGAFDDNAMAAALGCSNKEKVLYLVPVGVPK